MSDRKKAIFGSIFFHLLLFLLAYLIHYTILPESVFKRIELIEFGFNEIPNNERYISPLSQPSRFSEFQKFGQKSNLIPKKVELPKTFSESDEPVYVPQHEKIAYNQIDLNEKIGDTQKTIKSNLTEDILSKDKTYDVDEPAVFTSDEYLKSLTNRLYGESGSDSPYILEGEIANRKILEKVIPEYPEGIQISSKVKIRFDVLPDGTVTNMVIIQKADPKLELNSLNALSKWKFNPIPRDVIQKGIITFIYELR